MSWDFRLSRTAERALRSLPIQDRQRINAALNQMKGDPFSGDITALKGEYRGLLRRRIGPWRLVFEMNAEQRVVLVHDILRRTSTTY
jgi:mRNA-degrading endonuclease RelE of RelBE toxin-antitoxin system